MDLSSSSSFPTVVARLQKNEPLLVAKLAEFHLKVSSLMQTIQFKLGLELEHQVKNMRNQTPAILGTCKGSHSLTWAPTKFASLSLISTCVVASFNTLNSYSKCDKHDQCSKYIADRSSSRLINFEYGEDCCQPHPHT